MGWGKSLGLARADTARYPTWTKLSLLKGIKMIDQPKRHGGARAGAGRPKKEATLLPGLPVTNDPLTFLLALMNDGRADTRTRLAAAVAASPYCHTKKAEGVKNQRQDAAKKAATGKFGASSPPMRLVPSITG